MALPFKAPPLQGRGWGGGSLTETIRPSIPHPNISRVQGLPVPFRMRRGTLLLPSRLREGSGEGLTQFPTPRVARPLPQPLPQAGGEFK